MSQDVTQAHVAMVRGVKNCGQHHEENALAPAIQFAQSCDGCTAHIFATIYNAGIQAELEDTLRHVRRLR